MSWEFVVYTKSMVSPAVMFEVVVPLVQSRKVRFPVPVQVPPPVHSPLVQHSVPLLLPPAHTCGPAWTWNVVAKAGTTRARVRARVVRKRFIYLAPAGSTSIQPWAIARRKSELLSHSSRCARSVRNTGVGVRVVFSGLSWTPPLSPISPKPRETTVFVLLITTRNGPRAVFALIRLRIPSRIALRSFGGTGFFE